MNTSGTIGGYSIYCGNTLLQYQHILDCIAGLRKEKCIVNLLVHVSVIINIFGYNGSLVRVRSE